MLADDEISDAAWWGDGRDAGRRIDDNLNLFIFREGFGVADHLGPVDMMAEISRGGEDVRREIDGPDEKCQCKEDEENTETVLRETRYGRGTLSGERLFRPKYGCADESKKEERTANVWDRERESDSAEDEHDEIDRREARDKTEDDLF